MEATCPEKMPTSPEQIEGINIVDPFPTRNLLSHVSSDTSLLNLLIPLMNVGNGPLILNCVSSLSTQKRFNENPDLSLQISLAPTCRIIGFILLYLPQLELQVELCL